MRVCCRLRTYTSTSLADLPFVGSAAPVKPPSFPRFQRSLQRSACSAAACAWCASATRGWAPSFSLGTTSWPERRAAYTRAVQWRVVLEAGPLQHIDGIVSSSSRRCTTVPRAYRVQCKVDEASWRNPSREQDLLATEYLPYMLTCCPCMCTNDLHPGGVVRSPNRSRRLRAHARIGRSTRRWWLEGGQLVAVLDAWLTLCAITHMQHDETLPDRARRFQREICTGSLHQVRDKHIPSHRILAATSIP